MKKIYSLVVLLFAMYNSYSQMPVASDGLVYFISGNQIYNYNPVLPISSNNPSVNTINPPSGAMGLAVSNNLNSSSPSPTFYACDGTGNYSWYNGTSWVNTGFSAGNTAAVNPGGGGNYIYNLIGSTGDVYVYDGTGNGTLLTTVPGFTGGAYDVVGDILGNWYILTTAGSSPSLRQFSPSGSLIHTWVLTGTAINGGISPGFGIVGNKLYCQDNSANLYEGIISATSVNFSQLSGSLTPGPEDFATCPIISVYGTPIASTDSFDSYLTGTCSNAQIITVTHHFSAAMSIKTYFGDGQSISTPVSSYGSNGYAVMNHAYASSGRYTIKQVFYIGSTAIDSTHFTYHYLFCSTLPVQFYSDANANCVKDSSEGLISLPFLVEVDSNGVQVATISSTSGFYYKAYGNPGDVYRYKVLSCPAGLQVTCPAGGIFYDTLQASLYTKPVINIATSCSSVTGFDLAENVTLHTGRHMVTADIIASNTYCNSTNGVLTIHMSPKYNYGGASPTPTSTSGNTITWNLNGISSVLSSPHVNVTFNVPGAWLIPGDTVNSDYELTPVLTDLNPLNNSCTRCDTVRVSFDPNEMSVSPSGIIAAGTQLQYNILFENTGNDTAFNVYVMDTLSDNVDMSSFRIVAASAVMNTSMITDGGYNVVRFDFPDINLPDSSHHNQCDGSLIFNVNAKNGLSYGTSIFNHAGIFFDDNAVVMTNTVEDIIGNPAAVNNEKLRANSVQVYPNPANDELIIKTENDAYSSFIITNSIGSVMIHDAISSTDTKVSVKNLAPGIYFINLTGDNGNMAKRFVKM